MRKIVLITVLALAGCSSIESIYTDVPKEVAELQVALATAETGADAYINLPKCGSTSASLCHSPSVVLQIDADKTAAVTAVNAARVAETQDMVDAAQTAVTAYQNVVNALPKE